MILHKATLQVHGSDGISSDFLYFYKFILADKMIYNVIKRYIFIFYLLVPTLNGFGVQPVRQH